MLTTPGRKALAVLTFVVVGFLSLDWWASDAVLVPCKPHTEENAPRNDPNEQCTSYHSRLFPGQSPVAFTVATFLDVHNGVLIGVATAFLTLVTYLLVRLGREQSSTTRAQLRAYVHISESLFHWSKKDGEWVVDYQYRNSGQTPAYEVVVSSGLVIRNVGDPMPELKIADVWSIGTIGPNGDKFWDIQMFEKDSPISKDESLEAALQDGTKEVFLFGRIDYLDEFDALRWTSFRYSVGGEAGFVGKDMSACQEGNETERYNRKK